MNAQAWTLALAVAGSLALPYGAEAQSSSERGAQPQIDIGVFYEDLSPYGDWVEMPDYGWSFAPQVDRDWRPYTHGQWIWTEDGWYWDSDERFGWATYHYGRWANDRYYGWVWIPDTEWAPAWVSWRHGNGYTGWAPLPPRVTWRAHIGLNLGGLDIDAFLSPNDYSFVQDRSFVDQGVYQRLLPPVQNVTIIHVTNNITNYAVVNNRVVNRGIGIVSVEQAVGRRVPLRRTMDLDRVEARPRAASGDVAVFRPRVRAGSSRRPSQGRSLVNGEAPPAALVQRRKEREQEPQREGQRPEGSAKDAEQRMPVNRPQSRTPRPADQTQQEPAAPRPRVRDEGPEPVPAQPREEQPRPERGQTQSDREKSKAGAQPQSTERAKRGGEPQAPTEKQAKAPPQETRGSSQDKGNKKGPKPKPTPPEA